MSTVSTRRQSALTHQSRRRGATSQNQTPCVYDPSLWDLDTASFADATHARILCNGAREIRPCPQLATCGDQVAEQVTAGISPRCQVVAGRAFSHRGVELIGERSLLSYINRVEGQRKQGIDPDADPLEIVEVADDDSPAEAASNRSTARETLRALSMEVASSSGVQFALNLGA